MAQNPGARAPRTEGPRPGDDGELRGALARALLPRIDELTRRVVDDIHAHSGTYASGSPVSRDDLGEICRVNLLRALEDFGGLPSGAGDFEHAARETGRRRAEQGVALDTVLQAYRRGGRVMWQMMAEHLRATRGTPRAVGPVAGDPDTELDMAGAVWETIDRYSLVMAESYRLTQLEMQGRQETRRVALFEALLDGRGDDPAVAAAAAAALGVPLHDRYAVVVAAQDPAAPPNPAPVLDDHGIWSFWRPRSGRYAGIVRLAAGESGVLLDLLRHRTGATAGVSPEFDRLAQAGRALRLAEQALRTLPAGSGEAEAFDDRLAEVLLVGLAGDRRAHRHHAAGRGPGRVGRTRGAARHPPGLARQRLFGGAGRRTPLLPPQHGPQPDRPDRRTHRLLRGVGRGAAGVGAGPQGAAADRRRRRAGGGGRRPGPGRSVRAAARDRGTSPGPRSSAPAPC